MTEFPRATRSGGSFIPVCVKQDQVPVQREVKKSVGVLNKGRDSESWRRPLSVLDKNRGESLTSAADLSDSVFADARSRLSSLADSCVKHRRSLSRSGQKARSSSRSPPPPPAASSSPSSSSAAPHQAS